MQYKKEKNYNACTILPPQTLSIITQYFSEFRNVYLSSFTQFQREQSKQFRNFQKIKMIFSNSEKMYLVNQAYY